MTIMISTSQKPWGDALMKSALIGMVLLASACASRQLDPGYEPCTYMGRSNGCVTVPLASDEYNRLAKRFEMPPVGKARLYIVRSTVTGARRRASILIDGIHVATLAPMTYFTRDLEPGSYTLSAPIESELNRQPVRLAAGGMHFVRYDLVYLGGKWQGLFHILDESRGPEEVRKAKLINTASVSVR